MASVVLQKEYPCPGDSEQMACAREESRGSDRGRREAPVEEGWAVVVGRPGHTGKNQNWAWGSGLHSKCNGVGGGELRQVMP